MAARRQDRLSLLTPKLAAIAELPASTPKLSGLSAMVGLRGNLFPHARAYPPADSSKMDGGAA